MPVPSHPPNPSLILIMGVAGSGKTTVGRIVAEKLHWPYYEADDFHPPENREKMGNGIPLTDADRQPWLLAIRRKIDACRSERKPGVFTCSALKENYRRVLLDGTDGHVLLVHLHGDPATIGQRVEKREGHFMKSSMVRSQFEALEPPRDALTLDIKQSPEALAGKIISAVGRDLE